MGTKLVPCGKPVALTLHLHSTIYCLVLSFERHLNGTKYMSNVYFYSRRLSKCCEVENVFMFEFYWSKSDKSLKKIHIVLVFAVEN